MILLLLLLPSSIVGSSEIPRILLETRSHLKNPVCIIADRWLDLPHQFTLQVSQDPIPIVQFFRTSPTLTACSTLVIFLEERILPRVSLVDIQRYSRKSCRILFVSVWTNFVKSALHIYGLFAEMRSMPKSVLLTTDGLYSRDFFTGKIDLYKFDEYDFRANVKDVQGFTLNVRAQGIFTEYVEVEMSKAPIVIALKLFVRGINGSIKFVPDSHLSPEISIWDHLYVGRVHIIPQQLLLHPEVSFVSSYEQRGWCMLMKNTISRNLNSSSSYAVIFWSLLIGIKLSYFCSITLMRLKFRKHFLETFVKCCNTLEEKFCFFSIMEGIFLALLCDYFLSDSVFWYMTIKFDPKLQTIKQFNDSGMPICATEPSHTSFYLKQLGLDLANPIQDMTDYEQFNCALFLLCEGAHYSSKHPLTPDGSEYLYVLKEQLSAGDGGHTFYRDFPLIETYRNFQSTLIQAGLWSHWKQAFEHANRNRLNTISSEVPLTTSSLMICWQFWLFSCLIGLAVFALELAWFRWNLHKN